MYHAWFQTLRTKNQASKLLGLLLLTREDVSVDLSLCGILIDCDLKWQTHINYVYNKLLKFTSIFKVIRVIEVGTN